LIFPLILSEVFHKRAIIKDNLFKYVALVFCFLGIVVNFSRGSWLILFGVSVMMLFYLYQKRHLYPLKKELIIGLALSLFILLPLVVPRIISLHTFVWTKYNSAKSRIELMKEAMVMIRRRPFFGVGPGNFLAAMAEQPVTQVSTHFFYPVHNLYFLFASELGIPATACFLGFVFLVMKKLLLIFKKGLLSSLNLGLLSSSVVYLLSALIYYRVIGVNLELFFLLLAMVSYS